MTEQDDELKDLFRQKNLENAFIPDEQNWEKMASVLKNEKKNRRLLVIFFSLLLLILGLGGAWFYIDQTGDTTSTLALKTQPSEKDQVITLEKDKKQSQVLEKAGKEIVETQKPEPVTIELNSLKKERVKQTSSRGETQTVKKTVENETGSLTLNVSKSVKQVPVEEKTDNESTKESKQIEFLPQGNYTRISKNNENVSLLQASEKLEPKVSVNDHDQHEGSHLKKKSQQDSVLFVSAEDQKPDSTLLNVITKTISPVLTEKLDSVAASLTVVKDSIPHKTLPTHRLFLDAGATYVFGWKTTTTKEAAGFNPLVGLHYYHDLTKKFGLSIGLQYTTINHLSSTSHTSTTTRIKFGEETDVTVISALNMHYLLMPLKLNYSFSRNDFVGLGYTIAYLLDAESKVETYNTGLNYSSSPVVSKSYGYTKGFNPFDGQITVCYRRRVYKECYVSGEFFYGLHDIKNNAVYGISKFERAYGFKLSLGINLWKK